MNENDWLENAVVRYEVEKSKNPEYLAFDDTTPKSLLDTLASKLKNSWIDK